MKRKTIRLWILVLGGLLLSVRASAEGVVAPKTPKGTTSHSIGVDTGKVLQQQEAVQPLPSVPTNLAAAIQAGPLRITLKWTDASSTETSFAVWRSTNGGASAKIATVNRNVAQRVATGETMTYNDNNVVRGAMYSYYVTSVNKSGPSAPSNTVTENLRVPAAPTLFSGHAVMLPEDRNMTRLTLNWTDNADNETGFTIVWSRSRLFDTTKWFNVGRNTTTYSGFVPRGFGRYYRVRAFNAVGYSGYSNTVFINFP